MTHSPGKFVPGKGFVEQPVNEPVGPQTDEDAYAAERMKAALEKVGASMDRKLGRTAGTLPGRRAARNILGEQWTRGDNDYSVLDR